VIECSGGCGVFSRVNTYPKCLNYPDFGLSFVFFWFQEEYTVMLRYVDIYFTCLNCINIGSHAFLPLSSQGQPLIFVLPAFRL
jgi:hypothetical protein